MMLRRFMGLTLLAVAFSVPAEPSFPRVEVVPLPDQQIAFEIDGQEVLRYHGEDRAVKPFIFPLMGPAARRLTTMAHLEDPYGHRHHRSLWVAHQDVNGVNFWEEKEDNRIVMTRLEAYGSAGDHAWFRAAHEWRKADGVVVLNEQRTWSVTRLEGGSYYLDLTMAFQPGADGPVTFGKTSFGLLGLRVSPTVSVKFGGGRILNDSGEENEAGVHWKTSRWVDYSGPVAAGVRNGATIFGHPENPGAPGKFHVRDEGWMGACFTFDGPYTLNVEETLRMRYRIYVHGDLPDGEGMEAHWQDFIGASTSAH